MKKNVTKLKCLFGHHEYTQEKVAYYAHDWVITYIHKFVLIVDVYVQKRNTHKKLIFMS